MGDLFTFRPARAAEAEPTIPQWAPKPELGQYFTPLWIAEAIVERYFPNLDRSELICEPSCGPGRFLQAIPDNVPAIGVEIDPALAEMARRNTARRIITGDFRTVELDFTPTMFLGNPPFEASIIDGFLDRCYELLPKGGRLGMILPCYLFQTASRVAGYNERWSISQEMIPRNIFPKIKMPIMFATFAKDPRRLLAGFAFYHETADIQQMPEQYAGLLDESKGRPWRAVVEAALANLGGRATLSQLYHEIEGRRPTTTQWWREKVRQICQHHFVHAGPATYALPQAA